MVTYLAEFGQVTGCDISPIALCFSRSRRAQRLALASVGRLPFRSNSFDLVTSFDVLYEQAVSDDAAPLREFARVLVDGGRILSRTVASGSNTFPTPTPSCFRPRWPSDWLSAFGLPRSRDPI